MSDKKFPKPEEIQKEFEDFVNKKFGQQVQIIAQEFSGAMPNMKKQAEAKQPEKPKDSQKEDSELQFKLKPKEIKEFLDRYVVGQDEAKKALSIAVCDHYSQANSSINSSEKDKFEFYAKQNVLILGPTGVGKTYMIKQIAKLIGVPFVKADATRFSETGYMGANVDDLIKDLVSQAQGDISKAEYGIVYLDEADKLASSGQHSGKDVSGRGVQLGLLKLMEETEVDLRSAHDPASQMQAFFDMQQKGKVEKELVNTKHILFIVSGAFTGLEEHIAKRLKTGEIGFNSSANSKKIKKDASLLHKASTEDFISYGFEPEFVGRLPIRVACNPLDSDALYHILKDSEGSIIKQYTNSFKAQGIDVTFTDEALKIIAAKAAQEQTGARSLMTVIEKILRDYKFELPSSDIFEFCVDENLVKNPSKTLIEMLAAAATEDLEYIREVKAFEKSFEEKHDMAIKFDSEASKDLFEKSKNSNQSIADFSWKLLQSYEHGLKLIQQNTGQKSFVFGKAVVENAKLELEKMVKKSYNS